MPELLFNLGRVCERLGESDAALAHYRAYLKSDLAPAERAQIEKRVEALLALQSRQQEQLLQAPTTSALKGEARRLFERGRKFFHKKQYAAALAAFVAAKRYSPAPELDYNLALISERLALLGDAIDYYNAYLTAAPNAADAERVRARIRILIEGGATDR